MTGARVSVDQITDMIQSLHPHLRQGVSFPHPLLFQPVDAQPLLQREFMHPQPLYPLAAGAAEKNKKQQDDDPPHVVAVKEIAKAAHRNLHWVGQIGFGVCRSFAVSSARSFTIIRGAAKTVTKIFP